MTTATFSSTAAAARKAARFTPRVIATPEYVHTVICGEVVSILRKRVVVGANGELTIPVMGE